MKPCNLPSSDSTGYQDLKLQDLHFCVRNDRQDLALYGWYKPNLILPYLDLRNEIWRCRIYSFKKKNWCY